MTKQETIERLKSLLVYAEHKQKEEPVEAEWDQSVEALQSAVNYMNNNCETIFYSKWIIDDRTHTPYCEDCGADAIFSSGHNYVCTSYCPECGAKMKGV